MNKIYTHNLSRFMGKSMIINFTGSLPILPGSYLNNYKILNRSNITGFCYTTCPGLPGKGSL
jgi:hypothetical protein